METLTQATTTIPSQLPQMVSTATYVQAMQSAFTSSKFALQLELATALAVFASTGRVDRDTKKTLQEVYVAAGWDASSPDRVDYKTTMRRCQIASVLYTHIGRDVIASWIAGSAEMMTINTIVSHLAPLNLSSMDGTLAHCGKQRQPPKPRPVAAPTEPSPEARAAAERVIAGTEPQIHIEGVSVEVVDEGDLAEGHEGPLQPHLFRRAADMEAAPETMTDLEAERYENWLAVRGENPILNARQIAAGYKHVHTEHLAITVPPSCSKAEIIAAAMELLKLAGEMDGDATAESTSIEPDEEDAAEVIRHQQQEAQRIEDERKAALAKPIAPAPSRFRKPTAKK